MNKEKVALWRDLEPAKPVHARVGRVDLVVIRWPEGEQVSVLYGRCLHRGALLADGCVEGDNLICGLHGWDYRYDTGVSSYNPSERLHRFNAWVDGDSVWVDADEVAVWAHDNPQSWDGDTFPDNFGDGHVTAEEPHNAFIRRLAREGLSEMGHHGPMAAMGVPRDQLPSWDDIQLLTAQLHKAPLLDDEPVGTQVVIGPKARRPLTLDIPLLVSDMSFGALSAEAKIALARGAEMAGTAICSGEGGAMDEEMAESTRYFYELAAARFGLSMEKIHQSQAFHFKCGQAAKTGVGGHLPGHKVTEEIAAVRDIPVGEAAISPARFPDWNDLDQYRAFAYKVRESTGGIPIGFKLSAQHIERDIKAALAVGVDYIILDGRGGGTGAAPTLLRDHTAVPTIPALVRARGYLDEMGAKGVSLIITGGLRTPADFVKALALGADAIAVSNSALQAIGCLGMRACHTNNCPVGIATQRPELRRRLPVDQAAHQLSNFFGAATELMCVMARACGHEHLNQFSMEDLITWKREMTHLAGIPYGGVMLD